MSDITIIESEAQSIGEGGDIFFHVQRACLRYAEQQEPQWAKNWQNKVNSLRELIADLRPIVKARACEKPCDGGEYYADLLDRIEAALAIPNSCATLPHEKN